MPNPDRTHTAADSAPGGTPPAADTASFHDPAAAPYPFLAPPQAADEVGRLGKYRVLGVLGRGGMGAVFRAEEPALRRLVALKVMLPQFAGNELAKSRFLREARAAAAVEHDHILPILTVDEDRGVPFIAMPLLKGMPLSDALKAARPPLSEALRVGREMAEGLAAAHERGLVHRDIKPANVWLEGGKRRVKILDFGLARAAEGGGDAPDDPATESGAVIGTPAYMSLEQANGRPVDARTDLWSLGVVLYEMATGKRPFTGPTTMAILSALALHTPPPADAVAPDCPPDLARLIAALLDKDPARRPGSAAWVAAELARIEQSLSVGMAQPVPLAEAADDPWAALAVTDPGMTAAPVALATAPLSLAAPPPRRKPPLAWAVAGVAVLAAAVVGAVLMLRGGNPAEPTQAADALPTTTRPGTGKARATKPATTAALPPRRSAGYALEFDGNAAVNVPTRAVPTDGPFTLEAFVTIRMDSVERITLIAGQRGRSSLFLQANKLRFIAHVPGLSDGEINIDVTPIPRGRRVHLAGVRTPQAMKLFVDGTLVDSKPLPAPNRAPMSGFSIGDLGFIGDVGEIHVSKVARYEQNFTPKAVTVPDAFTVALYHCNEGTGDVLRDSSGNNHHGKIAGAKWVQADGANVPPAAPTDPTFFNGKDLTGWEGKTDQWRVEAGRLIGQQSGSVRARIISARRYRDFDLSFRITSQAADARGQSFLALRHNPKGKGDDVADRSFNVNFQAGAVTTQPGGKVVKTEAGKPAEVSVRCVGGEVKVVVNGTTLTDGPVPLDPEGQISWYTARQGETVIENIRFTDLSNPPPPPPAHDPIFFNGKDLVGWEGHTSGWRVEGGRLIGQQRGVIPARINTVQSYRDYELSFRITSAGGDTKDQAVFTTGFSPKANDTDSPATGGRPVNVYFGTAEVAMSRHTPVPVKPGQPVDVSIRCIGSGLRVLVNGVVLADGSAKIGSEGAISWIPARTGETVIENIRFVDLSKPADPPK